MIDLVIPTIEKYDENKEEFVIIKGQTIRLEHSLVSLSKWESKWCKPFLSKDQKTIEETIDYVRCMTVTQNVRPEVYDNITNENINTISNYIKSSMTATWFNEYSSKKTSGEIVTSEIIYYWMIAYNIPFECQKWHLNRLLTLIRVCDNKNSPDKKMSQSEIMAMNNKINNERRKRLKNKG